MRKTGLKMGMTALALVVIGAGCATGGGTGMSDEDAINAVVSQFETALKTLDLDAVFALIADDFEMSDGLGKAEYKEFLTQLKDGGQFDGVEMSADDLTVEIEGDKAEAMPFIVDGEFGAVTLEFELEKRAGAWLVTYINQIVG